MRERISIILMAAVILCVGQISCTNSNVLEPDLKNWSMVKLGMSTQEVEALLGPAISREDNIAIYGVMKFDDRRFPASSYFRICFDENDGKVLDKTDPYEGRYSMDGLPMMPMLIYPVDKQTFDHFPRFLDLRWEVCSGAQPMRYEVQTNWMPEEDWNISPAVDRYEADVPMLTIAWVGKNKGSWRVRAKNNLGYSAWSQVRRFEFMK